MELQLEGKRALVTGSSAGIGEAIAKALAGEGVIAAVDGRRPEEVARVVAEIEVGGGASVAVVGDLTVAQDCDGVAEQVAGVLGGLDILVNNAGQLPANDLERDRSRAVGQTYEANVVSVVRLLKRFLPGMIEQRYGRLIQIASGEASNPFPTMADYAASKAALVNASVSLAKALDSTGVTANTVSPEIIVTPGVEAFFRTEAPRRGWGDRMLRKDGSAVSAPGFGPMTLER